MKVALIKGKVIARCKLNRYSCIKYILIFVVFFNSFCSPQEFFWTLVLFLQGLPIFIWIAVAFAFLPVVTAIPDKGPFLDIHFKEFSKFVQTNFSSKITLSQTLLILFTATDNPDLLSLHA